MGSRAPDALPKGSLLKFSSNSRTSTKTTVTMEAISNHAEEESILEKMDDIPSCQEKAREQATHVEFVSNLNMYSTANKMRLSGIVCTIGPVSREPATLLELIENGMNVARMNFSHGSHEYHAQTMENCRTAAKMYKEKHGVDPNLAIALDTKGPEIRTGLLEGDDGRKELLFEAGDTLKLTTDDAFKEKCTKEVVWLDYKNITKVLTPGKRIYIDDGLISVKALEIGPDYVLGEIENGGNLGSRKGCNLPATDTDLPAVSEKDMKDLQFGVDQGVDMVFASFIRDAAGVRDIRKVLGDAGKDILIISKIENQQGVNNIDEIIAESDGIMVARGDMGIEIPPEKVFITQKQIIAACNKQGKPVICATQMLESMVKKPRPTRAEGSDVANAILDGSDCVMLSGETAKGDYPIQCIKTMAALSKEAESCVWNQRFFEDIMKSEHNASHGTTSATSIAAVQASYLTRASAIIGLTTTGRTAHIASKYRAQCPFLAITRSAPAARAMQIFRGVVPLFYPEGRAEDWGQDVDDRIQFGVDFGKKNGFIKTGDTVICITGWRKGAGSSNTIRILIMD